MPWIKTVADDEADGLLQKVYESALARTGRVSPMTRVMSLNVQTLRAATGLSHAVMTGRSPLSRAQRELLATVVSAINNCR